jgi:hypothetical protein
MHKFKNRALVRAPLLTIYMRELTFYSHGEHLQDRIMLIRRVDWTYKTSLIPSLFIEVSAPSQEGDRSCICL